jgi:hypothetical protein
MPKVELSICFNHVGDGCGGGGDVLHDPISPTPIHPPTQTQVHNNEEKRNALSTHLTSVTCKSTQFCYEV